MQIEVTPVPRNEDLETISQGIRAYNQEHLPDEVVFEPDTRFAVFAKAASGEVLGGIRANAFWNYCTMELLWIREEARGAGIGRQLVEAAESYAREKGFGYMRTETVSFQARPFYEKLGYTTFGELPDYPRGHTMYCLVKRL